MSTLGKLARGLLSGAAAYEGKIAEAEETDRRANILAERQMALEGIKQQMETIRAQRVAQAAADRQRDGETLPQSLRELDQLGIDPASDEGRKYIQNRTLDAQGPTATETTRRGQDVTERNNERTNRQSNTNNVRTTGTSRTNNIEDNSTTRFGYSKTPVSTVVSDAGDPTVVYKDGTTQPMRNAHLPGTADRKGGGGRAAGSGSGGGPTPPPMAPTKGAKVRDRTGNYTWVADGSRWHLEG